MNATRIPHLRTALMMAGLLLMVGFLAARPGAQPADDRQEVVFWHFWGGEDRAVVEDVVRRFNASQDVYRVRAVAMPGNNLDLKIFLSVAGGSPPDVVNQDDPIIADWASREALLPLDEVASPAELEQLEAWLYPAARQLVTYQRRMYGLCNGLDIRALYYNATWLREAGKRPPQTLADLDRLAVDLTEFDRDGRPLRYGYLPDPRRLWAWGYVFGGQFHDPATNRITPDHPRVVEALEWMASYARRFGHERLAAFRQGDQSLPGSTFPLLPSDAGIKGRYALLMDGQWRVRDIRRFQRNRRQAGLADVEFGVCPLPPPSSGRRDAGWVNGNFFVIPRGAKQTRGAWEFMKFWSGFGGHEAQAARTSAAGGWLPVSRQVATHPIYERYLEEEPLMRVFVQLASSPDQLPIPLIPGAPAYNRELRTAATRALYEPQAPPPAELLRGVRRRWQDRWEQNEDFARGRETPDAAR